VISAGTRKSAKNTLVEETAMNDTYERLKQGAAMLEQLERRRTETKTPRFGYDTERSIVDRELRDLERDILANPGALESHLVRVRRRGSNQ
jgi:hypothetical protein